MHGMGKNYVLIVCTGTNDVGSEDCLGNVSMSLDCLLDHTSKMFFFYFISHLGGIPSG